MKKALAIGCLFGLINLSAKNIFSALPFDTITTRHCVTVEFLGNSYLSLDESFLASDIGISPFSLTYNYFLKAGRHRWAITGGGGFFRSWWEEDVGNNHIYHKPLCPSFQVGASLEVARKQMASFWVGGYYIYARGKHSISYVDYQNGVKIITIESDYEVSPDFYVQLEPGSGHFIVKISLAPKIRFVETKNTSRRNVFPIWGGISIGGAW